MIAKKRGLGSEEREIIGKYLWRLFCVVQAYSHKNRQPSLTEVISIVKEFKGVFGG